MEQYQYTEAYTGIALTYFISKYGLEEGQRKYIELNEKKNFKTKTYSNMSQVLFKKIDKALGDFGKPSRWELKNFEYELFINWDNLKKIIKVDYYLNGKFIEFNGDYWHANPKIYKSNDVIPRFINSSVIAKDLWMIDEKRKNELENLGYKVKIVWESDYLNDPENTLNECVAFLKS